MLQFSDTITGKNHYSRILYLNVMLKHCLVQNQVYIYIVIKQLFLTQLIKLLIVVHVQLFLADGNPEWISVQINNFF